MAAVSTFPTPFLPCPGEPPIPFDMWLRMFRNYLLVVGASGDAWPVERKRALLLHCLGTEGQRLFYSLPNQGDSMEDAIAALTAHFTPRRNIVAERHAFRKRVQAPGETIIQYVAALRDLAVTCDFAATLDEMLRDQLVENVSSHRIRERLLLESELTLEKAVTIATQTEAAGEQAKLLSNTRSVPVQVIHAQPPPAAGRFRRKQPLKPPSTKRFSKPSSTTALASSSRECYRCGSQKHLANDRSCPAVSAQCNNCQKMGHYSRVCRSGQACSVREIDLPEVQILYMHDSLTDKIRCTALIATVTTSVPIELIVDSGSSVSILPKIVYDTHFKKDVLLPPSLKLVTYSRAPIPVLGCLPVTVSKDDITCSTSFFVVESGTALLGMDLINGLRLRFKGNSILPEQSSSPVLRLSALTPSAALGCAKGFVHKVKTSPAVAPVRQKLRRLPLSVRAAVSEEIHHLLESDIIERVDASPWVSPIVVVQKKSGAIRMCVDLREPNKAVVTDSYPLPHIEELLSLLRGASVFSTIDLESAYFQLPLHEESRDLTAFITHEGLFRFCRVPYGLASAPSAFQKMLVTVLQGLPNVANYLDDIILWGQTQTEHDHTLKAVIQRLQDAGLKLNQSKCQFNKTSLRFLGHMVNAQGIQPDEDHLSAILHAPAPKDAPQLRSFIGLLSWYNKFIPNFATVVEPLRACIRQGSDFVWSEEAQQSFDAVKKLLIDSPALSLFDPDLPTVVSTDASDYGLGAVLAQVHENKTERIVAFASRTLSPAERKYSTIEKEALACVWAVEKWRTYLWGRKFLLRTDHQALTVLLSSKGTDRAGMRIARWAARLLCFNYDVIYRPGAQNCTADCLSRLPLPASDEDCMDTEPEFVAFMSPAMSALSPAEFASASATCSELSALRTQIARGWPSSSASVDTLLRPFFKLRDELSVQHDYVFRGSRLVVPVALRHTLVRLAHEGHQGIVRTKQRLREQYWWPGIDCLVKEHIQTCQMCLSSDKTATTSAAPLQPVNFPSVPWEKVAIDVVGPFETAVWDCRYALTLIDYHSKWPEVAFTASITTHNVITFLSSVFSRYGNPCTIVSDNGPQFTSAEFSMFLKERNIQHIRTSLYHPAANGAIERFHRVLKGCIQSAVLETKPWKPTVTEFLQVYRATPHSATGLSPFELLHGRRMRTRLNVLPPLTTRQDAPALLQRVSLKQKKMKAYTDSKRVARTPDFKVGDWVRVRIPTHVPKAHPRFSNSRQIVRKLGACTYLLSDGKNWHASHLSRSVAPVSETTDMDAVDLSFQFHPPPLAPQVPETLQRVSTRVRRPPRWLEDCVT